MIKSSIRWSLALAALAAVSTGPLHAQNAPPGSAATDSNPVFLIVGGTSDGQLYPRNGGPFGFNGTFWYASLRINFD